MAISSIAEMQARLLANAKKFEKNKAFGVGDGASYPFWDIPDNTSATLRFLPDGNPENIFFWEEKENIKLRFQGVVGEHDREITITVPCMTMFGEQCPILALTRPWWSDPSKKELAKTYWKKKTYIFQGFVVNSPLVEEVVPENPIRRFVINPSIYEIVKDSLINPDMADNPTDYDGGRDFKLTKTKKGDYANYTTSKWSFNTRSLSEIEHIAIDQYGLRNLSEFKGRKPDAEELKVIVAMFHDSVAGRPFDVASYGKFYKPYGTPVASNNKDDVVDDNRVVATPESKTNSGGGVNDILEKIRSRSKNK